MELRGKGTTGSQGMQVCKAGLPGRWPLRLPCRALKAPLKCGLLREALPQQKGQPAEKRGREGRPLVHPLLLVVGIVQLCKFIKNYCLATYKWQIFIGY